MVTGDENGSDTDGYHRYYICFHISVQIRIRIRIVSTMSDRIRLDIDIINIRFEYSDMDTVSDVDIRTQIRTDLNPSKRIRFRIRSENIRTIFIPSALARPEARRQARVCWKAVEEEIDGGGGAASS